MRCKQSPAFEIDRNVAKRSNHSFYWAIPERRLIASAAIADLFFCGIAISQTPGDDDDPLIHILGAYAKDQPPVVQFVAPLAGARLVIGTTVTLTATASDPDPGDAVQRVEFFEGT